MNYIYKGTYSTSTNYNVMDVVTYKKSSSDPKKLFLCIKTHTSTSPQVPNHNIDTAYWAVFNTDSTFPDQVDSFINHTNMQASDLTDVNRFQQLSLKESRTAAENNELDNLTNKLRNKLIIPEDINKLQSAIIATQALFKSEVEGYITQKQSEFQATIDQKTTQFQSSANSFTNYVNQFSYIGAYSSSTQYYKWNTVKYNNETYLCIADVLGKDPTNATYWVKVAAKGDQGIQGLSGLGLVYKGSYDSTIAYNAQDAVNYGGTIYYCKINAPIGTNPTNTSYWSLFMSRQSIPVQSSPPPSPTANDLWIDLST